MLHTNIGVIGESNGGNLPVAAAAYYGRELTPYLRYIIQWETPVSSQIATRDLGRVWLKPGTGQGDYWNPRHLGYGPLMLAVDYSDLAFDPSETVYPLFHDGNGDGRYTAVLDPRIGARVPDLNLDGRLDRWEDFPLDTYPVDDRRVTYSRPVMREIARTGLLDDRWPETLVALDEAGAYWDLRESVRLYERAVGAIPELEAMILCGVRDHVQSLPTKPHIRQAFDGWRRCGAWVKVNPSARYLRDLGVVLSGLPDLPANAEPADWADSARYAMPSVVPRPIYEIAAIYEMADRARLLLSEGHRPDLCLVGQRFGTQ